MAMTGKDLLDFAATLGAAQTHGFVPSPGHDILGDAAKTVSASSQPVYGGTAPPLTAIDSAQPVAGSGTMGPPPPPQIAGVPLAPDLHNMMVNHFQAQQQAAAAQQRDAQAFLAPNGPISAVQLDALDKIKRAGDLDQAAQEKYAAGQVANEQKRQADIERQQREDEQRQARHQKVAQDYQRRADVLAEQAQNTEVRNFWADKSTGSRILGILAQTLSGAANGLAGNPSAPSPLDRIIDRDLELQKSNLQNKRLAADHALNALGQVYRGFESEDASIAAYRQAAAKWYASKSDELTAQLGGDKAPAQNLLVQAKAQQDIAKSQTDLHAAGLLAGERKEARADDNLAQLARDESNEKQIELSHQGDLITVPGVAGAHRKTLNDGVWRKEAEAFAGSLAQIDHIQRLVNKKGFSMADLAGSQAGSSLLTGDMRGILGTGANLSEKEAQDLKAVVIRYLNQKSVKSVSELGAPDINELTGQIRLAIARTLQARVKARYGTDVEASGGFESARRALDEDDAKIAAGQ